MSVKIRQYKRGGWEVDIRFDWPDGTPFRERLRSPTESKSASLRWGQAREAELLCRGRLALEAVKKEVPTLEEFSPRFLKGYAIANQQKDSGVDAKESILRLHLVPNLGRKKLDEITTEDVQKLKVVFTEGTDIVKPTHEAKTINNRLTVLSKLLKVAVEWGVISTMPCAVRLLKVTHAELAFYEFDAYARLVEAAAKIDERVLIAVLLGGDAGLRRGEIIGINQVDVDFRRKQLTVQRRVYRGKEAPPKSGKSRVIPMTDALAGALRGHRHLRGDRVLYADDGTPTTPKILRRWIEKAERRAGLPVTGGLHILRHTFCSHLAMKNAPVRTIQALAGHQSLSTTLRYMHLSEGAKHEAIALLDRARGQAQSQAGRGDILETAVGATEISKKLN